jgi:4'-phosphopantetheinyl transferase
MAEVEVWFARVEDWESEDSRATWDEMLSIEEKQARDQLVFPADQWLYSLSHGMLRQVLSSWTGLLPSDVLLEKDVHGRPYLKGPGKLDFNLSHTKGLAVVAVSSDARVGVDVESLDRDVDRLLTSEGILTAREREDCMSRPVSQRAPQFLRYWVLKESLLKCSGEGLRGSLTAMEFDLTEGALPRWSMEGLKGDQRSLRIIEEVEGFVIGLTATGAMVSVRLRPFLPRN